MDKVRFDEIPAELKERNQWVNWKYEINKDGKPTKIPLNPRNLKNAMSNNAATWGDSQSVFKNLDTPALAGIGFVCSNSDPYCGIDLDKCRDPQTGNIERWTSEIIQKVNSYTEVSPSGTGIRIIVETKLPEGSRNKKIGRVEFADSGKFFTLTGNVLDGYNEIRKWNGGSPLCDLLTRFAKDLQIVDKAISAANGDKFQSLWAGNWNEYPSQSEADMALASLLYFWAGIRENTDRLFRKSGLFRPKWDEKHFADGRTYGEDILDKVCKGETYKGGPEVINDEWPDPIPFDDYSSLPDFPVESLPEPGREMVKTVAEVNQVDTGLPASVYLSVAASCVAKRGKVDLISHTEPLNLFMAAVANSGERKTKTQNDLTTPIYEYQHRKQMEMSEVIRKAETAYKIKEARLLHLQKQAAKEEDYAVRKKLELEVDNIARDMCENPVPKKPIFCVDDITIEALGIHMADNNERMALFSAEGGIFQNIAGRYADSKNSNFDLILKAHSGDPCSIHRVGREPQTMQAPCLTIGLTVQPDVINEIGANEHFRGKGLLARFLYCHCKPQVGYRKRQFKPIPQDLIERYQQHMLSLMDLPLMTHNLKLSDTAQDLWSEFHNDIEREMRPGGSLEYLPDWGSKLPGAVARIAGILHFAENGIKAVDIPISAGIVGASCVIGGYFKEHALATFELMQADPRIEAAKKILDYLKRRNPQRFSGRDVLTNKNCFKTMEDIMPGLKILVERGYIREVEVGRPVTGRPRATTYEVNPKIKNENA
jgi:hypothetical protein